MSISPSRKLSSDPVDVKRLAMVLGVFLILGVVLWVSWGVAAQIFAGPMISN